MEKVLDQFLRSEVLTRHPLHPQQQAYQQGKSTLRSLTYKLECACRPSSLLHRKTSLQGSLFVESKSVSLSEKPKDLIIKFNKASSCHQDFFGAVSECMFSSFCARMLQLTTSLLDYLKTVSN
uniref:Uncharacterized protein n=1 Tax=Photinus pyralis TaxID=7054 RepID=A0A1Y1KHP7_PHOPY